MSKQSTAEGSTTELPTLIGRQLSAVTFVRDYVQLHFDGPTISAFTWPTVSTSYGVVKVGDVGYRDSLCSCIGKTVLTAIVDVGERLEIAFSDGFAIAISLRTDDREVEEAVLYQDDQSNEWSSW
jgi:hypothetical protein